MRRGPAKSKGEHKPDYFFMLLVLFLLMFGLVVILSASSVQSFENFGTNYYYFNRQLLQGGLIGLIAFAILSKIDYRQLRRFAVPIFGVGVVLLVLVLITGADFGGAQRWISLGPIFFQPIEVVKLATIIYLAAWFSKIGPEISTWKKGFAPFVAVLGVLAILILAQPDLGSLIMVTIIAVTMYFVAGAPWRHLGLLGIGGLGALGYLISVAPYRVARLTVFLNPELDPQGIGYQINQALLAVGSGGVFGLGLGQSRQKYNYLPEVSGDSVFAVISEELGLIRAIILVALFLLLAVRGYHIAKHAQDDFGKFLAVGITTWLVFQAFMNIMAIIGLLPLTGIPLPFISYGSSSLVVTLAAAGILMNISRFTTRSAERSPHHVRRPRKSLFKVLAKRKG